LINYLKILNTNMCQTRIRDPSWSISTS